MDSDFVVRNGSQMRYMQHFCYQYVQRRKSQPDNEGVRRNVTHEKASLTLCAQ